MTRSIPETICGAALSVATLCLSGTPASADNCKGFTTMEVSLAIAGKPGDGFRIIGKCGDQEVARCVAVIPAGKKKASCQSTGLVEGLSGRVVCSVGPKNGNSDKAVERASSCFLQ